MYDFFFIAGAQRSGTTFLYNFLDSHPEIAMAKPVKPEPKFFIDDRDFEKGRDYYLGRFFHDLNVSKPKAKCIGEKSTSYMEFDFVPERVESIFPGAKCIIVLRNPVERAVSNYFFTRKHGLETRTLREVFIEELPPPSLERAISVSPFAYKERGNYSDYLLAYKTIFGDRLKIVLFEELVSRETVRLELLEFLQVSRIRLNTTILDRNAGVTGEIEMHTELGLVKDRLRAYYSAEISKLAGMLSNDFSIWKPK